MGLELLTKVRLFPVRHHSPRTSAVLEAFLDAAKPQVVLIEGPRDANGLLDVLCDAGTKPPVAILGYRTDGAPASAVWPFAAYSPEYRALLWAKRRGARAEFIDIPTGVGLATEDAPGDGSSDGPAHDAPATEGADDACIEADAAPAHAHMPDLSEQAARALGFRSFEELWEATFEAPAHREEDFRPALMAYAELVRAEGDRSFHRARDAFMAKRIFEVVEAGVPPESIAVVVGAAHAAAFAAKDVELTRDEALPAPVPSAVTVIPYSFPRLAEQMGYGAGNRAPQFYQRAHEAGCDFKRATLEVLIAFADDLRLRGFSASLADVIEAYRLAVMLSELRGKSAPGLDEVREAAIATLCRGEAAPVDGFLWDSVIGRDVGRVASRIGKNSLQEEFWRELDARKLPRTDSPEDFTLRLNNEVEIGTSVFLHRLRVADIPYAAFFGSKSMGQKGADPAASGYAALASVREAWQAQWTPSTDVALVEKIVLGDSLEQVATRVLEERLAAATRTSDAAEILLESVLAGCARTVGTALRACDRLGATDEDLPSLAHAARNLSGLLAYGNNRGRSDFNAEALTALCQKLYARAVLRVRDASSGTDEAVAPALEALRTLHELALSQPLVDKAAWFASAQELKDSYAVNATASGLATGLLYLAQRLTEKDVADTVTQRVSIGVEPLSAARFLEGFMRVNALVLVKNREVVRALDGFLCALEAARFKDTLPVLRRSLGILGPTERRYLMENVVALRSLKDQAKAAKAVLEEKDKEKLQQMSGELSKALDDLDDLL